MKKAIEITSESNSTYKKFLDVKKRGKKYGLILIEGEDLVETCILSKSIVSVITLTEEERYSDLNQVVLSKKLYKNLSSYQSLPKVMGIAKYSLSTKQTDRVIFLDGIQDPGNLGTIERSALAFGFNTVVLSKDCVSPYNSKAVQASKGSMFNLNIKYGDLKQLSQEDYKLYLTCLEGEDIRYVNIEKKGKICLVIGNEGQGIRKENLNLPGKKIRLEISSKIESLNAGVAASVFMYLWS